MAAPAPSTHCLRALRQMLVADRGALAATRCARFNHMRSITTKRDSKTIQGDAKSSPSKTIPEKSPTDVSASPINSPPSARISTPASTTSDIDAVLSEPTRESRQSGPRPLSSPLGVLSPPFRTDNTGIDARSLQQRRDDFVNHDKHLERRAQMERELYRPWFKDFNDMRFFGGKVFLAPSTVIKARFARYFPNLVGRTLALGPGMGATTDVLTGKVSLVTVASSGWGEAQCRSFVGDKENPPLQSLLDHRPEAGGDGAQLVEVNYEPSRLKYWLITLFLGRIRAQRAEKRWGRYFVVRKGFTQELRLAIGMPNAKVGQVYVVDGMCRIRWAGHAMADEDERKSLVKAVQRVLGEAKEGARVAAMRADVSDAVGSRTSADEEKAPLRAAAGGS